MIQLYVLLYVVITVGVFIAMAINSRSNFWYTPDALEMIIKIIPFSLLCSMLWPVSLVVLITLNLLEGV